MHEHLYEMFWIKMVAPGFCKSTMGYFHIEVALAPIRKEWLNSSFHCCNEDAAFQTRIDDLLVVCPKFRTINDDKSLASMIMFTSFPHPHTSTNFLLGPMYAGHHLFRNHLLLPALLWGICGPPFLDTGFKPPCTRGHDSKSWFPNLFSKDIHSHSFETSFFEVPWYRQYKNCGAHYCRCQANQSLSIRMLGGKKFKTSWPLTGSAKSCCYCWPTTRSHGA